MKSLHDIQSLVQNAVIELNLFCVLISKNSFNGAIYMYITAVAADFRYFECRFQASLCINTLRPRQDGRHFADDIFKCIFLNKNVWMPIKISLKFLPKGPINNIPAMVQIMAWRRPGDKPLSEPIVVSLPTHICVARPQWVNGKLSEHWFK